MALRKHCTRCGKLGIRADTDKEEVWTCPDNHGEIFRAPLPPAPPPEAPAEDAAAPALASDSGAPPPEDDGKKKDPYDQLNGENQGQSGQQQ